jgi:hypothetical protein
MSSGMASGMTGGIIPLDLHVQLAMQKSIFDKFLFLNRRFTTPNQLDFQVIDLPEFLFWLYFIIRPVRIFLSYSFRAVRSVFLGIFN